MTKSPMDMDQFMNDFLDGMYLPDPMTDSSKRSQSRRKSHNDVVAAPPKLRRAKTSDDANDGRRSVRRTKSGDGLGRSKTSDETNADKPARRGVRRTKSGESLSRPVRRRSSHKDQQKQLDPAQVLRMLEMYADMNDTECADAMLHYGAKDKEVPAGNQRLPNALHVNKSTNAA